MNDRRKLHDKRSGPWLLNFLDFFFSRRLLPPGLSYNQQQGGQKGGAASLFRENSRTKPLFSLFLTHLAVCL